MPFSTATAQADQLSKTAEMPLAAPVSPFSTAIAQADQLSKTAEMPPAALVSAVVKGQSQLVDALIYAGCDPNHVHSEYAVGATVLHLAIINGNLDCVDVLIANGANVLAEMGDGITSIALAENSLKTLPADRLKIVRKLQDNVAKLRELSLAASAGKFLVVDKLLKLGPSCHPNSTAHFALTPLFLAAGNGHVNVMVLLLAAGAFVNAKVGKRKQCTSLLIASVKGHDGAVTLLARAGADVNFVSDPNCSSCSTLSWAVLFGHLSVCKVLVEHGASVSHKSRTGDTPLHFRSVRQSRQSSPS